jgi:hypothetical protein
MVELVRAGLATATRIECGWQFGWQFYGSKR